ncbi:lysophospholipid acyltransferase family protein [Winogradskyella sp.]|jgi:KDO2-lipid IV(A) lauroyltransferase|uniref:lysophospholipid acyltransferase family protein n=1 Tax=Winogradskyella sp. TaxID=1883156 RepID=UPI0025E98588|nr:lysophospholipid acyltransferase family protein [Winogradskyella sp.]MCT4630103.1 lysophospholipid acyltransferase family protein [Winogradskyella sp.]
MQLIAYIIIYPILWLISILPFRLLYTLSDVICFFLYRIFGYRKSIVKSNLRLVFPDKSEKEIKTITFKFYKHLCDLFLEMIKTLTISKTQLNKRFVIKDLDAVKQLESYNTSIILMYGHYASYEWSTVIQTYTNLAGLGIYKKIANKYFDKLVRRIRSKYKTELIHSKKALPKIAELNTINDHRMIAFLSDQSPKYKSNNVWLDFMDIKIPCFVGAEVTAKKYNYPVGFLKIDKVKRGHYEADIVILSKNPSEEPNFKITERFNTLLEQQIKAKPEFYLWTHKRWKHKDKKPK